MFLFPTFFVYTFFGVFYSVLRNGDVAASHIITSRWDNKDGIKITTNLRQITIFLGINSRSWGGKAIPSGLQWTGLSLVFLPRFNFLIECLANGAAVPFPSGRLFVCLSLYMIGVYSHTHYWHTYLYTLLFLSHSLPVPQETLQTVPRFCFPFSIDRCIQTLLDSFNIHIHSCVQYLGHLFHTHMCLLKDPH